MNDVAPLAWLAAGAAALTLIAASRVRGAAAPARVSTRTGEGWAPFDATALVTLVALHLAALSSAATWLDERTVAITLAMEGLALAILGMVEPWRRDASRPNNARGEPTWLGALGTAVSLATWLALAVLAAIALPGAFAEATAALEPSLGAWLGAMLLIAIAAPLLLAPQRAVSNLVERVAMPLVTLAVLGFLVALAVMPPAEGANSGAATLAGALRRAWWMTDARADGLPNAAFAAGVVCGGGLAWISLATAKALRGVGPDEPEPTRAVRLATLLGGWMSGCLAATTIVGATTLARVPVTVFDPALDREVVGAHHLELPIARAHAPSSTLGQTIVLAEDTALREGSRYPIVYRADPRGAKIGLIESKLNRVRLAADALSRQVEWISFRSRERVAGAMAGFDLRVPVRAVARRGTVQPPASGEVPGAEAPAPISITVVTLEPTIDIDLEQLASRLDGPYIHLPDAHYVVTVTRTRNAVLGEHLTAYLDEADRGDMPPLRRIVGEMRYRGPYLDTGEARAPLAMIVAGTFPGRDGDVVRLRHEGPPRGAAIGLLRASADGGELILPAWPELAVVREAILRHREDPALDRRIPVIVEFAGDGLLHARSAAPDVLRFVDTPRMKDFDGPFLVVPPTTRRYELRGDARLPRTLAGFRALIPLDAPTEMNGRREELARPHFLELEQAGFAAPSLAYDGMARAGRALELRFGAPVAAIFLACLGLVIGMSLGLVGRALSADVAAQLAPRMDATDQPNAGPLSGAPGIGLAVLVVAVVAGGHGFGLRGDTALLTAACVGVLSWAGWALRRLATRA